VNDRIKELADEAGLRFTQLMSNPMVPVVDGRETDLEKFAELIVRECIDWIDGSPTTEEGSLILSKHFIIANLKHHFGVKEKNSMKDNDNLLKQPKYKVRQRVKYETSPHQPDWKDGGRGVGVITAYKNGHYIINGNPVNHFEIKGVVEQGVAEGSEQQFMIYFGAAMKQVFNDLVESGAIVWVAISVSLFVIAFV
jgi:hypothetical protein